MRGLITQRQVKDEYQTDCDRLEKDYVVFFEELGYEITPVSNFQNITFNADFLVLTGGGNIHNEQPQRDKTEEKLYIEALNQNKPIIGICRGMQYINILLGGKLTKNANLTQERKNGSDHSVLINDKLYAVNNYHNDVIFKKDLASKLNILAEDTDNNTIEAFYSNELKILGIQWHPERKFSNTDGKEYSKQLIKDFINSGVIK